VDQVGAIETFLVDMVGIDLWELLTVASAAIGKGCDCWLVGAGMQQK